jgi:hypothetical protein
MESSMGGLRRPMAYEPGPFLIEGPGSINWRFVQWLVGQA